MLAKRIVPCLDVRHGKVVKGVEFSNLEEVGEIGSLADLYGEEGADELVFYDITASVEDRLVGIDWVRSVASRLDIPFSVAGGIRSVEDAWAVLRNGADKISINSPAIKDPSLLDRLVMKFGSQCIVSGIDSMEEDGQYYVYKHTGSESKRSLSGKKTLDWVKEVEDRGCGEIVLNCMRNDGRRGGYDIKQLELVRGRVEIPIVASGGAGSKEDFLEVLSVVDAALAASVFHRGLIRIGELKCWLRGKGIEVRI